MRLTAESILRSFQISDKKHLFLTGARGIGKSTLAKALTKLITDTATEGTSFLPGITTTAIPGKQVLLTENSTNQSAVIGTFSDSESKTARSGYSYADISGSIRNRFYTNDTFPLQGNRMRPAIKGFFSLGIPALTRAAESNSAWVCIDELGYLETACPKFQEAVLTLLEKKSVLAVIRKQDTPFLTALIHRDDAFVIDLDAPIAPIGCVIMASGLSRRFGSNKLLEEFHGKPLISHTLELTGNRFLPKPLLSRRVVITRTPEVQAICRSAQVPVLLHNLPDRSDTVMLGIQALSGSFAETIHTEDPLTNEFSAFNEPLLTGYMFCPADQPLISRESMEALCLTFSQNPNYICRLGTKERPGTPVIFPKHMSEELLTLPKGKGGSFLIKKYPEQVLYVPVGNDVELLDADTPEMLAALAQISL